MFNSERINSWVSLLANIGILLGLVLVAVELNQNTKQLALELEWQVNQKMFENNRDLMGDNPTPIYAKSVLRPQDLTYEEFQVAVALIINFLNVWEDRYYLYEKGLSSDQDWKDYVDSDIGFTLGNQFAQQVWRTSKSMFEPELVEYVDEKLSSVDTKASYQWYLDTLKNIPADSEE